MNEWIFDRSLGAFKNEVCTLFITTFDPPYMCLAKDNLLEKLQRVVSDVLCISDVSVMIYVVLF